MVKYKGVEITAFKYKGIDIPSSAFHSQELLNKYIGMINAGAVAIWDFSTGVEGSLNTVVDDKANNVGKNLFDGFLESGTISSTGVNATDGTRIRTTNYIEVKPNTTYTPSKNGSSLTLAYRFYDENKAHITNFTGATFTTPANCKYIRAYRTSTDLTEKWQIELGNTSSDYEPYKKQTAVLKNFAGTTASGNVKLPIISPKGEAKNFVNLLGNDGNFAVDSNADGLADGFTSVGTGLTKSVSNNIQTFIAGVANGGIEHATPITTSKLYYCAYVKSPYINVFLRSTGGVVTGLDSVSHTGSNLFEFLSVLVVGNGLSVVYNKIYDKNTSAWQSVQIKQAHVLYLTQIFGAGNEPTKDQMDVIVQQAIARYGYINTRTLLIEWKNFLKADGTDDYAEVANIGIVESASGVDTTLTNLLGNEGDMIDSNADNRADGWGYGNSTGISCSNHEVVFLPTAQWGSMNKNVEVRNQSNGDMIYFCGLVKSTSASTTLNLARGSASYANKTHSGSGNYEFLSVQNTLLDKTGASIYIESNLTSGWTNISVKQAHLLNLTAIFGAGKEPSKYDMDILMQAVIAKYGYFSTKLLKLERSKLDFVGTQDFAFMGVFVTPSVLQTSYLIAKNYSDSATIQYGINLFNDTIQFQPQGISVASSGAIKTNSINAVECIRKNNILKFYLNGIKTYESSNTLPLVPYPFIRLFARSSNVSGTGHGVYSNNFHAHLSAYGANVNETKLNEEYQKLLKEYGIID